MTSKRPAGITPKHELGQHFIVDERILRREIEYAGITASDTVLEIGAGPGTLTTLLAQTGARVIAVEIDRQFRPSLEPLQRRYPNVDVRWGDAMVVPLPDFTRVVANLPYKVALPLILRLLNHPFHTAVLVIQARLARRICAAPDEPGYSRIAVTVQRVASLRYLETVKTQAFDPPPAVDSAMIRIRRTRPRFAIQSEASFKNLLDFMFVQRESRVQDALGRLRTSARLKRALAALPAAVRTSRVASVSPDQFGAIAWELDRASIQVPPVADEAKRTAQKRR